MTNVFERSHAWFRSFGGRYCLAAIVAIFFVSACQAVRSNDGASQNLMFPGEPMPTATPPTTPKNEVPKTMKDDQIAVSMGMWADNGIILNVNEDSVDIQFACADARIDRPLMTDSGGNFSADGIFETLRPGPTRAGDSGNKKPAHFEGKITGNKMAIHIALTQTDEVIGQYNLELGKSVRLRRCL